MRVMLVVMVMVLLAGAAYAAPFMISDPYPLTENQPEEFVIAVTGQADVRVPVAKTSAGEAYLLYDLATTPKGVFAGTVKAYAVQWGYSDPTPFSFPIGISVPKNLRLGMEGLKVAPQLKSPSKK